MFYQVFFSPQVKRLVIITYKHGIYQLPHELPNDFKLKNLRKLGNVRLPREEKDFPRDEKYLNKYPIYPSSKEVHRQALTSQLGHPQLHTPNSAAPAQLKGHHATPLATRYPRPSHYPGRRRISPGVRSTLAMCLCSHTQSTSHQKRYTGRFYLCTQGLL